MQAQRSQTQWHGSNSNSMQSLLGYGVHKHACLVVRDPIRSFKPSSSACLEIHSGLDEETTQGGPIRKAAFDKPYLGGQRLHLTNL
jgi:hypothetical protein